MKKVLLFLPLFFFLLPVSGHVPIVGQEGSSFENPYVVSNPVKSWSFYYELAPQESLVLQTTTPEDMRVYVALLRAVRDGNSQFVPEFFIVRNGFSTALIAVPEGYGALQVPVEAKDPVYEPFGPSVYTPLAEQTFSVQGDETIYFVVRAGDTGGHLSFVIGTQESFTISEIVLNPIAMISVYLWEGQSLLEIFFPALIVALAAFFAFRQFNLHKRKGFSYSAYLAASFFAIAPAIFGYQIAYSAINSSLGGEIIISLFIVGLQSLIAVVAFRYAINGTSFWKRATVAMVSLFLWVGFVAAPLLFVLSGASLDRKKPLLSLSSSTT